MWVLDKGQRERRGRERGGGEREEGEREMESLTLKFMADYPKHFAQTQN